MLWFCVSRRLNVGFSILDVCCRPIKCAIKRYYNVDLIWLASMDYLSFQVCLQSPSPSAIITVTYSWHCRDVLVTNWLTDRLRSPALCSEVGSICQATRSQIWHSISRSPYLLGSRALSNVSSSTTTRYVTWHCSMQTTFLAQSCLIAEEHQPNCRNARIYAKLRWTWDMLTYCVSVLWQVTCFV